MRSNIQLEEAHHLLLNLCPSVSENHIAVSESWGRILSRDIFSPEDIPRFNKSAKDGYAISVSDTFGSQEEPVTLKVIDKVMAGALSAQRVTPGTAIRIMTGAPVPDGANAIVPFENVVIHDENILISGNLQYGSDIIFRGDELSKGELIASKGTKITPVLASILSGLGMANVPVYRTVTAAVMSTGNELLDPSEESMPGKIFNSSIYGIIARCQQIGVHPVNLGNIPDTASAIASGILEGLGHTDIVITTGGISEGDCDAVEKGMDRAGVEIIFKGLALGSGISMIAGLKNGKPIIALSGSPVSALATFNLTVTMLLKKIMGYPKPLTPRVQVVMSENFTRNNTTRKLLHARLFKQDGIDHICLIPYNKKRGLMAVAESNFLVDLPAGCSHIPAGQKVWGYPVGDLEQMYMDSSSWVPVVVYSAIK